MKLEKDTVKVANRLKARVQRGFGLLEIAIGLVIAAALAAAIMTFFQNANNNAKTNETLAQIAAIQSAVQGLYNGQPTYSTLTTANIASSGALPAKMIVGSTMRNPFNGNVTVTPNAGGDTYTIEMALIPSEPCLRLVSQDLGRNMSQLEVVGSTPVTRRAMSITEAQGACNVERETIRWTFY
jgi:prepilin-type N-terminal cleavage/methylation domain-containing protein